MNDRDVAENDIAVERQMAASRPAADGEAADDALATAALRLRVEHGRAITLIVLAPDGSMETTSAAPARFPGALDKLAAALRDEADKLDKISREIGPGHAALSRPRRSKW